MLLPMRKTILLSLLLCVACPAGSDWGTELSREFGDTQATMFHSASVDAELAGKVLDAMVAANYNFYSDLPEQLDRVDGRLVLRLGNDNEESLTEVLDEGEESGVVNYMHGLAWQVSQAAGGEPVDVALCRKTLDDEVYTVVWTEQ